MAGWGYDGRTMKPCAEPADPVIPVRVEPQGIEWLARPDEDLVRSALDAGWLLPRSCRNGTCRTCRCRLLQGRVRHRVEWPGLSREELSEGWILPCVALPLSAVVLEVEVTAKGAPRSG